MPEQEKDKKYYWLKLKRDFFKRHDIQIIEDMENGKDYILFYLKLLCESVDHEGSLRFSEQIPYSEKMLSTVTHTNIDIVRSAIKVFSELGMMEILDDGTIFMNEVHKMMGSETYWAEQKRIQRGKQKLLELDNVQQMSNECPTCPSKSKSIEIDIEKEKETEIDSDKKEHSSLSSGDDYSDVMDLWNTLEGYGDIKPIKSIQGKRKDSVRARLKEYGVEGFADAVEKIKNSRFLQGENKQGWTISFDWFIKPNNFPKVIEGNYLNKNKNQKDRIEVVDTWV